jgi:hypothetical protein
MKKIKFIALMLCLGFFFSCGDRRKSRNVRSGEGLGELIDIPVDITSVTRNLLDLRSASSYLIQVEGCLSGFSSSATEAEASIRIYKDDQNCLAKLQSLTIDGSVYQPLAGSGFQTWKPGELAVFQKVGSPNLSLRVTVVSQLSSPVTTSDSIQYSFSEISQNDSREIPNQTVSEAHTITVNGELAPQFQIASSTFKGLGGKGGGIFEFTMECNKDQVGSDAKSQCGGSYNTEVDYKLIEDTSSGKLTYQDALIIFSSPGIAVLGADNHTPGTLTKRGGFKTSSLNGLDELHKRPKMILVLRQGKTSFTYFNIKVSTIAQR